MKKHRTRTKPKPPPVDPLAAQLAEFTKLVLLGANLYHAGMKQNTPPASPVNPGFTFATQNKPVKVKEEDKLPEV